MSTYSQDYAPLPGSVDAAVQHARTIAKQHQPDRIDDAEQVVRAMVSDSLTRTEQGSAIRLVTTIAPNCIRFEVRDPNTPKPGTPKPSDVWQLVSALADRYGSRSTRDDHMSWAELYVRQVAPV
ncbi:hypothetical protein [Streptosporangium sp. NPDC050280]|uniref:hypothetical protein n=1 Tax=unclassified Streptosporangium TaxID=2632669 RepID=UPI00344A9F5F